MLLSLSVCLSVCLSVSLFNRTSAFFSPPSALLDYWILKTDYTSYAIAYICVEKAADSNNTCKKARSWLWSRSRALPEQVKADARNLFQNLCMNMTLLYTTDYRGDGKFTVRVQTFFFFFLGGRGLSTSLWGVYFKKHALIHYNIDSFTHSHIFFFFAVYY